MFVKWLLFKSLWVVLHIVKGEELQWHLFHQSDYVIKSHRIENIWYNNSYFKVFKVDYTLYNRTKRALSGGADVRVDISNDIRLDVQLYKMMSNEYRFFPITVTLDICKEVERNSFGVKTALLKTSNLTGCPVKKGYYYLRHVVLDHSRFPPFMPHGHYKMQMKFYHSADLLTETHAYYEIAGKPLLPML